MRILLWNFNKEAEAVYRKMGISEQRVVMEKIYNKNPVEKKLFLLSGIRHFYCFFLPFLNISDICSGSAFGVLSIRRSPFVS